MWRAKATWAQISGYSGQEYTCQGWSTFFYALLICLRNTHVEKERVLGVRYEVDLRADLGLNQVIAVDRRGHGHFGKTCGHELEECHLRCCVLHRDAVRVEVGVAVTTFEFLVLGVGEVVDEDLFRQCQRPIQSVAGDFDVAWKGGVDTLDQFDGGSCTHRSHVDNYNTSS